MSIDLEIRSDDEYSRTADRQFVIDRLLHLGATQVRGGFYRLDLPEPRSRLEIDLGFVEAPHPDKDRVRSVGLGVRSSSLRSADAVLKTAFDIAEPLGWRVFDPQRGGYVPRSELDEPAGFRAAASVLRAGLRAEPSSWLLARFLRHLPPRSLSSTGSYLVVAFVVSEIVNRIWGAKAPFYAPPGLTVALVTVVVILILDSATDVLVEVAQRQRDRATVHSAAR